MNVCILVGKVISVDKYYKDNPKLATIKLEVERPFKDADGLLRADVFTIRLWRGIADQMIDNGLVGYKIAITGRIENDDSNNNIVAEKISYISKS